MADAGIASLGVFSASLTRAAAEAQTRSRTVMRKVAYDIQADAQRAAPVDTGFLRSSIGVTFQGNQYVTRFTVAPTADYAGYVEFGTSRMPPRPYMQPALDRNLPRLQVALAAVLGNV